MEFGYQLGDSRDWMADEIRRLRDEVERLKAPQAGAGLSMIAVERRRQIEAEGWTPEHDDRHTGGVLACSAAAYALIATHGERFAFQIAAMGPCAFKPGDVLHNLARAGALIAAEIDRLMRLRPESRTDSPHGFPDLNRPREG